MQFLDALKDLNLELVGPYDILLNRKFKTDEGNKWFYYRYFYDLPEFVTVLKGDNSVAFHVGYFRYFLLLETYDMWLTNRWCMYVWGLPVWILQF